MKRLFALATALLLTACSAIHGDYPRSGSVIPDAGIRLTPGYVLHFDDAIHIGGGGEARQVLARRAETIARERGYGSYQIVRYEESLDSRIFLPRRTATAEIRLMEPLAAL
jgi:hypothetical protein